MLCRYFVTVALLDDGDFLLWAVSSHHPEVMSVSLWNTTKLAIEGHGLLVGLGLNRGSLVFGHGCAISERFPGSENSDVIHIAFQGGCLVTPEG